MKKYIVESLFLSALAIFHIVFWSVLHYGFLNYAYSNAYFDISFEFFADALNYCHLTQYIENFLLAFFRWHWLGTIILFIPILGIYFITRAILKTLNLSSLKLLAFFPAILMMSCQYLEHFFLQKSLVVLFITIAIYIHILLKDSKIRFVLLFGVLFTLLFFSRLEFAILCVALLIVELLLSSDKQRYILAIFYLIFAFISFVFYIKNLPNAPLFRVEMPIQIGAQVLLILLFIVFSKFEKKLNNLFLNKRNWLLIMLVISFFSVLFISNDELEKKELLARLDLALLDNDTDKILLLTNKENVENQEDFYPYIFYALAQKGQLAQKLFQYKVNVSNFLPEALPTYANSKSVLSVCFYEKLGLLNEAMHQAYQMGISCNRGDTFRSLCLLVDLNIARGDYRLVEKYLAKLAQTLVHDDFVCSRKEMLCSMQQTAKNEVDFKDYLYINKDQFLNISYALFLAKKESTFVKDYFLCSLLLTGEFEGFCSSYKEVESAVKCNKRIYAEALVMARDMGIYDSNLVVSDKVEQDWILFKTILGNQWLSKKEKEKRLLAFRNTWWHYYLQEFDHLF